MPLVVEMVHPRSVVDVGCGEGAWLRQFEEAGIRDLLGVDRKPWSGLQISPERFLAVDFDQDLPALPRRFDLAVCLEVAEHLPEARAEALVATLVAAAPAILFSAAIPGQAGQGHVNCQWPEYWAALFEAHGYGAVDCIRPRVWGDADVEYYYQQNAILYLDAETAVPEGWRVEVPARLVHPTTYQQQLHLAAARRSTKTLLRELAGAVPASLRSRLAR